MDSSDSNGNNKIDEQNNTDTELYKNLTNFNNFVNLNYNKKKPLCIPYILNGNLFEILKINYDNGSVTVRCLICKEDNIYKGNVKSTGNFHMHIKRKHPLALPVVNEMKLKSNNDRKARVPRRRNLSNGTINGCTLNKRNKSIKQDAVNPYILDNNEPIDYRPQQKKTNTNNVIHSSSLNMNQIVEQGHVSPNAVSFNQSCNNNILQPLPAHISNYVSNSNQIPIQAYPIQYYFNKNDDQSESSESLRRLTSYATGLVEQTSNQSTQQMNLIATQNAILPQSNNIQHLSGLFSTIVQESLLRVEGHLKGIEREMNLRNQIETNKIYLELAKFKYLNPGFK